MYRNGVNYQTLMVFILSVVLFCDSGNSTFFLHLYSIYLLRGREAERGRHLPWAETLPRCRELDGDLAISAARGLHR